MIPQQLSGLGISDTGARCWVIIIAVPKLLGNVTESENTKNGPWHRDF